MIDVIEVIEQGPKGDKGDRGDVGPAGPAGATFDQDLNTTDAVAFASVNAPLYDAALNQPGAGVDDAVLSIYGPDGTAKLDANGMTGLRVLALPDESGTLALTSQIPTTFAASAITSGTMDAARLGSGTASSGTWLRGDSTWQAMPAAGTKTYFRATPRDNQPPATAFATLDTRNSIAVLDFDDATDESAVFVSIIPEAASLGSGLKIRLHWMATTATSGNVVWDVSLERMTTDLDSDSFDTIASGTAAANGTSGILTVTEITLTTIDSVTAGDGYRLKVTRDANNASDTMTGDAELVAVEVRSAA